MKNCRSCRSEQLEEILDLGAQPWGNDFIKIEKAERAVSYPLRLFFCHSCSMVQIDYTVAKEKMFVDHAYMSGTTKSLKNHFVEVGYQGRSRTTEIYDNGDYDKNRIYLGWKLQL